jgi:hypothetical protein
MHLRLDIHDQETDHTCRIKLRFDWSKRLLLAAVLVVALCNESPADYRSVIRADRPVAWWSFDESDGEIAIKPENTLAGRDTNLLTLVPETTRLHSVNSQRGVRGLAAFLGATPSSRVEMVLNSEQDQAVERTFNGSFSLEMWVLDKAGAPNNRTNYSLLYKADRKSFVDNSLWFYRTRQSGDYSFRVQGRRSEQTKEPIDALQLTIPNPAGRNAAGDGQWHHLVIVVDRTERKRIAVGFLDGKEVARAKLRGNPVFNNDGSLIFGNSHHRSSTWAGGIDEVAIYDKPLSDKVIARHFEAGKAQLAVSVSLPKVERARGQKEKIEFFELKIRPLLVAKCTDCHSGEPDSSTNFAITSRQALLAGGDFGTAVIPGNSGESNLIKAVKWTHKELRMPPEKDDRLSRDQIALLARWIDEGAVWPESQGTKSKDKNAKTVVASGRVVKTDHWSFQPRKIVAPSQNDNPRWAENGIDRFLQHARQQRSLTAIDEADRRTLIRRATFDLVGLPPTPKEVAAFVTDDRPDGTAFAAVVDRLLKSPHYGERWGRHWLDVARYADTQGDVGDIPIPQAWLYRNWVIDSLNADLPFDRFLQAQIAGDVYAQDALQQGKIDDAEARQLVIATGFIALAQRYGNSKKEHLHLTIENTIDTIGRGILGLTLRCSRCHDHPFDPVLQSDYYGLYGILDSTTYPSMGMSVERSPSGLAPVKPFPELQKAAVAYWTAISGYEYQINNHFRPWLKPTLDEYKQAAKQLKAMQESSDSANEKKIQQLKELQQELLKRHDGRFRELMLHGLTWLRKEKSRLAESPPVEMVFAASEGKAHDAHLQKRGEPKRPGSIVPRRFLQVVDGPTAPTIASGSGRRELAEWLTRKDHPLVARVIVNRIWQRHFGNGFVSTSDNLGVRGELPTHPELLDWLAEQFIRDGWSLKKLHRRIVMTRSYRLSSNTSLAESSSNSSGRHLTGTQSLMNADPGNTHLWRFPRRRLEAEAIRDAMLAVSGQLDRTQGQTHPFAPWHKKRYGLNGPFHDEFETNRRSVYLMTQRLFNHSFLGLFDAPDTKATTTKRTSADVAGQALYLMNSPFIRGQSEAFANRLISKRTTTSDRIELGFQLAYGRSAKPDEQARFEKYVEQFQQVAESQEQDESVEHQAWTSIARAILTSNEFFFVD